MSEGFTGSTGLKLYPNKVAGTIDVSGWVIAPEVVTTLREYFQQERDNRLGLWRWAANPDYVVRVFGASFQIEVRSESNHVSRRYFSGLAHIGEESDKNWAGIPGPEFDKVAVAYFYAHPGTDSLKARSAK